MQEISANELFDLLPEGVFHTDTVFNKIREYSPLQRFPTPKYELYNVLQAWNELIRSGRVKSISDGVASKVRDDQYQCEQVERLLPSEVLPTI